MFVPTNVPTAFIMVLCALLGWSLQANTLIGIKTTPGVYHMDMIIWRTIWCFIFMLVMGSKWVPPNVNDSFENLRDVFSADIKSIFRHVGGITIAGITDMMFQAFFFSGIVGAGLSASVPLQIGTATFLGAFLTFLVEKKAKLQFFIPGVLLSVVAVSLDAVAYSHLRKDQNKEQERQENVGILDDGSDEFYSSTSRFTTLKVACICIIGGIIGTPFGPGIALAGQKPHELTPYTLTVLLCLAGAVCTPLVSFIMMRFPLIGPISSFKDWWGMSFKDRFPAILGALFWSIGTLGYTLAAPQLGYAITYVFGQSTPFVTSLIAIFYWREFKYAKCRTWIFEITMLLTFAVSVGCICFALSPYIVCFMYYYHRTV